MKILLIQPNSSTKRGLPAPPIGLMYLASVVEKAGFEVKIVDRNIETNTLKSIKNFSPDIIGISAFTGPMILDGLYISKKAKEILGKEVLVIWGGIHPSLVPESTLINEYIDIIVIGEGEQTFLELLLALKNRKPIKNIQGVGYKEENRLVLTEKRGLIKNLDELPFPAWHLVKFKKYLKYELQLFTSRGCPHRCAFCYNQKFNAGVWRGLSAERVLKEIEYLESLRPIRRLKFYDDNFAANRERFSKIVQGLSKDHQLFMETRVDYINKCFIEKIKKFNDPYLLIGVESGSSSILKKLQKDITISQIKDAFTLLKDNQIGATASFMIGIPGEKKEDIQSTLKLMKEINPTRFTCCMYKPYPGCLFYDEISQQKPDLLPQSLEEWGKFSSVENASLNCSDIDSKYLEKICRKFYYLSMKNLIMQKRYKKLYAGFRNYFRIEYLNILRYFD